MMERPFQLWVRRPHSAPARDALTNRLARFLCRTHGTIRRCVALLIALTIATNAAAQQRFDSWTTENGLPQNSVNDILQTRDGYLWAATHGGLVRFDGVRFTVFDASVDGVRSQRIRALHEDRHGTLWAATEDGMLIRYRDGRFITYTSDDGLPFANAVRIDEDDEGSLWITWIGVVTKFDGTRFMNFAPGGFPRGVSAPPLSQYTDAWWSHDSDGVHVLSNGQVSTHAFRKDWLGAGVAGVTRDRRGNYWIRTRGAGLIRVGRGGVERYTTREGLARNDPAGQFIADSQGGIWSLSFPGGLYRIRDGTPQFIELPQPRSFYEDREGSFWVGTVANGLHRLDDAMITLHEEVDGLSLKNAYSILQDRTGAIWIGHDSLKRLENGRARSFGSADGLSPLNNVTSLYEDKRGRLWVGTQQGLTYFDGGHLRRYEDRSGLLTGSVWAMHEDSGGSLWFATDAGLVKVTDRSFTRYTTDHGLSHNRITALFETRAGALWVGTMRGLTRLENGVFTAYTEDDGFVGSQVRAIHEDADGVLWVGTYDGGLYRVVNDRLTRYTRKEGLHDNGVFQLLEDAGGYLWMGSNRGISRVSRSELNEVAAGRRRSVNAVVFGPKDGLISVEINGGRQPSGLKTSDGRLWFPTMGGLGVIDPADYPVPAGAPSPLIEELLLAGAPAALSNEVVIPSDVSYFDIRYTAPTFTRPEQVRFRYRLVGLDNQWVEAGDRRTATFHRIPPGKYQFVVTASNAEGVWNAAAASLAIVVLPPFWRTWWFAAVVAITLTSVVAVGHQRRVARLRQSHELQEAFSRRLIDSQESERRRISGDMHDSLGQCIAIIKKRVRATLEVVSNEERVRAELDEIAVLADRIDTEMKDIAQGLRPYHLDKIGLAKSIETMVHQVGSACGIVFTTDIAEIDTLFPDEARIHVYRIVQECVSNVVKHSRASHAKITIVVQTRHVEITVDDNGQGFSGDALDKGDPRELRFGLMGLHERARMLGGRVAIRPVHGGGTAVVVTLQRAEAPHA